MELPKACIATASTETEAEAVRIRLLDLGVPLAWKEYAEIIGAWAVLVRAEDARGAYVRLLNSAA